jgi:MFS transporter, ACS family, tartrate transporter
MDLQRADEEKVIHKITGKLIPFLFILYIAAYLDRINVGFAALEMNRELSFSSAVYGLGAGIFFIGYFIFEIPSNLILSRVGARIWIARIMITWGMISSSMIFVKSPQSFYTIRFLLGLAEAGFFPGIILYLTFWFPQAERARSVALFMTATVLAGTIGGPLSGLLFKLHHFLGLSGWQWIFLVEGIPSIVLGIVVIFHLPDGPRDAKWLTEAEKTTIISLLEREKKRDESHSLCSFKQALMDRNVWKLALVSMGMLIGMLSIMMWLPQFIKQSFQVDDTLVGFLSAIPYLITAVGMVIMGRHSDLTGERTWHMVIPFCIASLGMVSCIFFLNSPVLSIIIFAIISVALWGTEGPFWALATSFLSGSAAACGIALINSFGNLGGFIGPYLIGFLKDRTGDFRLCFLAISIILLVTAAVTISIKPQTDSGITEQGT